MANAAVTRNAAEGEPGFQMRSNGRVFSAESHSKSLNCSMVIPASRTNRSYGLGVDGVVAEDDKANITSQEIDTASPMDIVFPNEKTSSFGSIVTRRRLGNLGGGSSRQSV